MNVKNNVISKNSRTVFKKSLIELLDEKYISEISVTELCNKANMNRSTFYSHYENVIDVLDEIQNDIYEELENYLNDSQSLNGTLNECLSYVKQNSNVFKVLLSQKGNERFKNIISKLSFDTYKPKNNADSEFVYHRIFNINGFVGIIEHWLNTGMEEDVEYLSNIILKFSYLENEK